jgi:putative membrane protein
MHPTRMPEPSLAKGIIAGLLGGVAASAAMLAFQRLWSTAADRTGRPHLKPGPMFDRLPHDQHQRPDDRRPNSSEAAARKLARHSGVYLGPRTERLAGVAGHFAYGAAMGTLYGVLAESNPRRVQIVGGIGFGLAVFLFDQFLLPAAGLAERPDRTPASTQLFGAANHVIYGAATELVRSAIRAA